METSIKAVQRTKTKKETKCSITIERHEKILLERIKSLK